MAAHLQFVENEWTCPQTVTLSDGSWAGAPYMQRDRATGTWKCLMCAANGSRVTAYHLAAVNHKSRTEGAWNH
eukprot:2795372-Pyramimonas_sp.AAC.1